MKKILSEAYEWKVEKKMNKSGQPYYIAAIDPTLSTEDTFAVKDKIKEFGGRWDNVGRRWYFILSSDPNNRKSQIERFVKPCVEYLKSVEKSPNGNDTNAEIEKMLSQIDDVVAAIEGGAMAAADGDDGLTSKDMENKLLTFKQELINSFKNNTFREKMGPIIKFRQAQGPAYSILNSVLTLMQKPDAKMVKSGGNWRKANKEVKPGAKKIWLWVPIGERAHTPEECKEIEANFFKKMSKLYGKEIKSKNELNVGEREKLEKKLKEVVPRTYELMPRFYDVSDVTQMAGKEDLIGSLDDFDNVEWFDDKTEADDKSTQLYNAVIATIQEFGINLSFVNDLGGARGVSKSGSIDVLQDAPKNIGTVSTLVHELSHELLHQTYLRDKKSDKENFGEYFVGREFGTTMVEQQAEISAWIVMRNFGYDMQTAKNYVACWGGDDKTATYAFDSVAKVATRIIKGMNENMSVISEEISTGGQATGLDIAKMVGMEDVYMRGKQEERQNITQKFNAMLERIENPLREKVYPKDDSIAYPMSMLHDVFNDDEYWRFVRADGKFNENDPYFNTDGETFAQSLTPEKIRSLNNSYGAARGKKLRIYKG